MIGHDPDAEMREEKRERVAFLAKEETMEKDKPPTPVASRANAGKVMLSFVLQFPTAIKAFARVMEIGAVKYLRDNWKKGGKPDWEYLDACLRHLTDFENGETFAADTGCLHLAHAMWNIMAIIELNYPGVTHDPERFAVMMQHWADVRDGKKPAAQNPLLAGVKDGKP